MKNFEWEDQLRELKELAEDEVISNEDFEEQKLKIMGTILLGDNLKLSDALRELKDLQEDEINSEAEFNVLKEDLMNK